MSCLEMFELIHLLDFVMSNFPEDTRRNNNVIITSKDIAKSFWRNNHIIIKSCACWVSE